MIRYVTRWALTTGIRKVDGEYTEDGGYFAAKGLHWRIFVSSKEAFVSIFDAQAEARRMATRKCDALRKQIAKLGDAGWEAKVLEQLSETGPDHDEGVGNADEPQ